MDSVLADTLKAHLKDADTAEKRTAALVLAMIAVVDCQQKTADRVKKLVADTWRNRAALIALAASGGWGAAELVKIIFH